MVMTGYLQSFLFFEDDAKEEVLSSFRLMDDLQDDSDAFLLPYVAARNLMVGVHIRGDDRDECLACVIAKKNFLGQNIDIMRQSRIRSWTWSYWRDAITLSSSSARTGGVLLGCERIKEKAGS